MSDELDPETRARREAALQQVLRYGDPALRTKARPVERFDAGLAEEVERMTQLLDDALGAGLAATQLGVMNRVFVYRPDPDTPIGVFVNPELEGTSDETVLGEEGCLSIPGVWVEVERPEHVRMRGYDGNGRERLVEGGGRGARVPQHELAPLDGVLMLARITKEQPRGARGVLRGAQPVPPRS